MSADKQPYWAEWVTENFDTYEILHGPNDFECVIGEIEDHTWGRDLKPVMDELNRLEAENAALRGQVDVMRPALVQVMDSYGHGWEHAFDDCDYMGGVLHHDCALCETLVAVNEALTTIEARDRDEGGTT